MNTYFPEPSLVLASMVFHFESDHIDFKPLTVKAKMSLNSFMEINWGYDLSSWVDLQIKLKVNQSESRIPHCI
jgi:hypothetical protein